AQRTAEMHLALADERGLEEFRPQPFERRDVEVVVERAVRRLRHIAASLAGLEFELSDADQEAAQVLRSAASGRRSWRPRLPRSRTALGLKIRCHGDYHLGQVLWARNDFYIVDFEGEVG